MQNREEWFKERIGKRVYRNNNGCVCSTCTQVALEGLIIGDEMHASYLQNCEAEYTAEGHPLRYFDTWYEAQEFAKLSEFVYHKVV